jgi:hypothetical protein
MKMEERIKEITLLLLYLTSWKEDGLHKNMGRKSKRKKTQTRKEQAAANACNQRICYSTNVI